MFKSISSGGAINASRSEDGLRGVVRRGWFGPMRLALIVFHLLLLWDRLSDSSILEPVILAKWIGGALVVSATFLLQRFVPAVMRTRRASVVFWLLVLVLHISAPFDERAGSLDLEMSVQAGAALTFGLLLLLAYSWLSSSQRAVAAFLPEILRPYASRSRHSVSLRAPPAFA